MVLENLIIADECPSNWVFQHLYRGFASFVKTNAPFDLTCVDKIFTYLLVNCYIKATGLPGPKLPFLLFHVFGFVSFAAPNCTWGSIYHRYRGPGFRITWRRGLRHQVVVIPY